MNKLASMNDFVSQLDLINNYEITQLNIRLFMEPP